MDVQDLKLEQDALHTRLGQMHNSVDKVDEWGRQVAGMSRANLSPESRARLVKNFPKASQLLALGVHDILWLDSDHQMPCTLPERIVPASKDRIKVDSVKE